MQSFCRRHPLKSYVLLLIYMCQKNNTTKKYPHVPLSFCTSVVRSSHVCVCMQIFIVTCTAGGTHYEIASVKSKIRKDWQRRRWRRARNPFCAHVKCWTRKIGEKFSITKGECMYLNRCILRMIVQRKDFLSWKFVQNKIKIYIMKEDSPALLRDELKSAGG